MQKKDCTLYFDTRDVEEGYHAVNVMIEDHIRPVKRKSKPLSKVPLLFLLFVDKEDLTCPMPMLLDPPSCKTAQPGELFQMVIRADPGDPSKPYVSLISDMCCQMMLLCPCPVFLKKTPFWMYCSDL